MTQNSSSPQLRNALFFLLPTLAAVGLSGYLSYQYGQQVIGNLASQRRSEASERLKRQLNEYFAVPQQLVAYNGDLIASGTLNPQERDRFGQILWNQAKTFKVGFVLYGWPDGDFLATGYRDSNKIVLASVDRQKNGNTSAYEWETDDTGKPVKLLNQIQGFSYQKEGWYNEALQKQKQGWSSIYNWDVEPYPLSISAIRPLYNANRQLQAVMAVEQTLAQTSDFLKQLQISPNGATLLIERNGLLIADSASDKPFRVVDGKPQRIKAVESENPRLRAIATELSRRFPDFTQIQGPQQFEFFNNRQREFVQVIPWRDDYGLDLLAAIAVPESDFQGQIAANRRATMIWCLGTLTLAGILAFAAARWLPRSLTN